MVSLGEHVSENERHLELGENEKSITNHYSDSVTHRIVGFYKKKIKHSIYMFCFLIRIIFRFE
jgi:hypothetical protein